ncbi:MAG: RNB domain-containing ribonuclease [Microbacterium sp.]
MVSRRTRLDADGELAESLAQLRADLQLPTDFPPEALAEAETVAKGDAVDGSDGDRTDLREIEFLTIDPEGSRDLDQAMSIVRDGDGFIVRYAIADLPAFIRPGGAIDAETWKRGQTLYPPDGTIPLHPEVLSTDAASLLPDEDRRAYVWHIELNAQGARREQAEPLLRRTWVRSRRQWAYAEAQQAVDDGSAPETLTLLATVGPLLIAQEAARGGASLNSPEEEVTATDGGYRLTKRVVPPLEDWNAQISLLAGMTAAGIMLEQHRGILRTMPPADDEALAEFRQKVKVLGRPWSDDIDYGEYLRRLDPADPVTAAVTQAAASLFRGADYVEFLDASQVPTHDEQSAIAAPYAHTTAPLRRLVDRFVLQACLGDVDEDALTRLPEVMRASGSIASRLESGAIDRVEAAVLRSRIGQTFDAVVLSSSKDQAKVQIADPFVTANVPSAAEPGSTIHVRVDSTDITKGTLSLSVV